MILESEELHRTAYNDSFKHFKVQPEGRDDIADWSVKFYDMLQNTVGGGKPKMRWYFGKKSVEQTHRNRSHDPGKTSLEQISDSK